MAELQCGVLVKRKTIPAHGGLRLRSVHETSEHLSREITRRG